MYADSIFHNFSNMTSLKKVTGFIFPVVFIFIVSALSAQTIENSNLLGKWNVDGPKGPVYTFSDSGKLTMSYPNGVIQHWHWLLGSSGKEQMLTLKVDKADSTFLIYSLIRKIASDTIKIQMAEPGMVRRPPEKWQPETSRNTGMLVRMKNE